MKVHFDKFQHQHSNTAPPNGSMQQYPNHQQSMGSRPPSPQQSSKRHFSALNDQTNRDQEQANGKPFGLPQALPRNESENRPADQWSNPVQPARQSSDSDAAADQRAASLALSALQNRPIPGPLHFPHEQQYSTGPAALMSPQPGGPPNLPPSNDNRLPHSITIPANGGFNPMSPQSSRIPMTPSMPGFSFHPFPQTPPLLPHFLSPGLGPFSPPLGTASFGSTMQQMPNYMRTSASTLFEGCTDVVYTEGNADQNHYNQMFGYFPGPAQQQPQYEAPTPPTQQASADSPAADQSQPAAISQPSSQAKDASADSQKQSSPSAAAIGAEKVRNGLAPPAEGPGDYFPPVSSLLARRATSNTNLFSSAANNVNAPRSVSNGNRSASTAGPTAEASRAEFAKEHRSLEAGLTHLNLQSAVEDDPLRRPASNNNLFGTAPSSLSGSPVIAPATHRPIEKLAPGVSTANTMRRASFEANSSANMNARRRFGESIWS